MLDNVRTVDADDGGLVQFSQAGARAAGAFRCSDCGYGVTVQVQLPRCPMCRGTTWEADPAAARSPIVQPLL